MNTDIWLRLVESDSNVFQLHGQLFLLCFSFLAIKHHEKEIGGLADTDDLSTTSFAVRGSLNNTWQIQKLHPGVVDGQDTWDAGQCCELVGSGFTGGVAKLVKK